MTTSRRRDMVIDFARGFKLFGVLFSDPGGDATKSAMGDGSWAIAAGGVLPTRSINTTAPLSGGGNLSADRTIALDDDGVTNTKLANMATKTYKGRTSALTGDPEDVAVATLKTDLVLVKGDVGLGNVDNTSDVNKPVSTAQQTAIDAKVSDTVYGAGWNGDTGVAPSKNAVYDKIESVIAGAYVHPNHSGDVTSVGDGAQTIANDAVTYAKMQNVSATDKVLGRSSVGAGDVEEIACTAAGRALIDDADASAQRTTLGLVIGTNVQAWDTQLDSLAGLSYAGNTLKVVRVNAGETDFELATISGSGLTQPQVMARCCGC